MMVGRILVGLVSALAVLAACTDTGTDNGATVTPTTAASTTLAPTTAAPEEAHLLTGEWLTTYTLQSVSEDFTADFDPGDSDLRVWVITPDCEMGPCDVDIDFRFPYTNQESIQAEGEWDGQAYVAESELAGAGSCAGSDESVFEEGLDLRSTIRVTPTEFEAAEGGWVVAGFEGTRLHEWVPNAEAEAAGCDTFTEEYTVSGAPHDPKQFTMPTADPLEPGSLLHKQPTGLILTPPEGEQSAILSSVPDPFAISPDGRTIAYSTGQGLWLMGADGSDPREVFPDDRVSLFTHLAWSSDGSKVAFVRDNIDEGSDVWFLYVPYGVPERVTSGGFALGGVTWGPGDSSLIYDWGVNTKPPGEGTVEVISTIYQTDLESGSIVELATDAFRPHIGVGSESLSFLMPDFRDTLGGPVRWSIVISRVDGTGQRIVLTAGLSGCGIVNSRHAHALPCPSPVSPDGTAVAFSDGDSCADCPTGFDDVGVWRLKVSGGEPTRVAESGWHPQWVVGARG